MFEFYKRLVRQSPQQLAADVAELKRRAAAAEGRVTALSLTMTGVIALINVNQRKVLLETMKKVVSKPPSPNPPWLDDTGLQTYNNARSNELQELIKAIEKPIAPKTTQTP